MSEKQLKSKVYSEAELLDIIDYTFTDHTDIQLERELTAHLQLVQYKDKIGYFDVTSNEGFFSALGDFLLGALGIKYVIKAGKAIFTPEAVAKLVDGLSAVKDKIVQWISGGVVAFKKKCVKADYIEERFTYLNNQLEKYKDRDTLRVRDAVEYDLQYDRFRGLLSIVNDIYTMARSNDNSAFASDRIFDQMADKSNSVMKTVEPMAGSAFRTFKWVKPFTRDFDIRSSEWNEPSEINRMKGLVLSLRTDAFDKLVAAAEHIKKICEKYDKAEVQHVRFDNYELMTKEYTRGYAVTKFVQDLQSIILKEINTFCTSGISNLTKFEGTGD